jgi:tetrahydromethanopterin S-methyltransferase subunit G
MTAFELVRTLVLAALAVGAQRMREFDLIMERLDAIETKIDRLVGLSLGEAKRDKAMAKGQEKLSQEVEELRTAVDAYTTAASQRIEAAVAEARAAWESGSDQEFERVAAQLDEIAQKLASNEPVPDDSGGFTPSGM